MSLSRSCVSSDAVLSRSFAFASRRFANEHSLRVEPRSSEQSGLGLQLLDFGRQRPPLSCRSLRRLVPTPDREPLRPQRLSQPFLDGLRLSAGNPLQMQHWPGQHLEPALHDTPG